MAASAGQQRTVAERRDRVLQLRANGLTLAQIAKDVGLPSASAAAKDLARGLAAAAKLAAMEREFASVLEAERLDTWQRACQLALQSAVADGDHGMALRAVGRLVQLTQCRMGLGLLADSAPDVPDELEERRQRARQRLGLA